MKKNYKKGIALICIMSMLLNLKPSLLSGKGLPSKGNKSNAVAVSAGGCEQATSEVELDVNNVSALLFNGGDMWWDRTGHTGAVYEIPKGSDFHSLFAGAIWFGGLDANQQIHLAGQTYRQYTNGAQGANDFFAGPLDTVTTEISATRCATYDRHFKINCADIERAKNTGKYTADMLDWPAHGHPAFGEAQYLAPFKDMDGDGVYEPLTGDYPEILGDQAIWWVMNDKGNEHTKYPGGLPIGLEIHAMAFAYATSDEINDMTFYKYKLINRSNTELNNTYFGKFADADLGNAADDYIGCDAARNLAFAYNGDDDDESGAGIGYGLAPPAVGIRLLNNNFGTNGGNLPMSSFMYFTNSAPDYRSDPDNAMEVYRYLRGMWADGTPLTYGGNGYDPGSTDYASYAYPGTTDPKGRPEWSEITEKNYVGDRRMIQAVGPFTFTPGSVYEISIGVAWARDTSRLASVEKMKLASDKAQQLADNNFIIAGHTCNSPLTAVKTDSGFEPGLFPNPMSSFSILKFAETPVKASIRIYDLQGRTIRSETLFGYQYAIDKKEIKAGIYLVSVTSNGKSHQKKLIVH